MQLKIKSASICVYAADAIQCGAFTLSLLLMCCPSFAGNGLLRTPVILKLNDQEIKSTGIEVHSMEPETGVRELIAPGVAAIPPQQMRVAATPAAGIIENYYVSPDEDVKEGDPIASLRSPDLVEAQRAYLTAVSEETVVAEKLRRDEYLLRQGVIVETRLQIARAEAAQAKTALEERMQILMLNGMTKNEIDTLHQSRKIISSLIIRSPMTGAVIARQSSQGERIAASSPLATIAKLSPIWVNIQAPVSHMASLPHVTRVFLPAFGVEGKLMRIGRTVDQTTQSINVVAEFNSTLPMPKPGQAVQAALLVEGTEQQQWRVPSRAIGHYEGGDWVFVREQDGFRAIPVQIASEDANTTSIQAALDGGEQIVTRGVVTLLSELAAQQK